MPASSQVIVHSTNDLSRISRVQALAHLCHSQDKLRLCLRTFGIFWGVAVLCIFIPVFHFVLVPLFFIVGLGAGFKALKVTTCIDQAEVPCPVCGQVITYKKFYLTPPKRDRCPECSTQLGIDVVLPSP